MTKMLVSEYVGKWYSEHTFTYRSKAELGSHLSSSELDLIFSRAVLAAIVAFIGFTMPENDFAQEISTLLSH